MTATVICPNCQSTVSDLRTGSCAVCGSGMMPIPLVRPANTEPADIVILEESIRHEPFNQAHRPPSSTSSAETLILPPGEDRDGSTAIRLGSLPSTPPAALPSGISSTNKFTLVEELGRGGMGVILRGRDKVLHRDVALKVIRDPTDNVQRERFIKEAQVTGQLEHPNIVPVHEFGVDQNGRIFFAMKLVRGRTLGEVLDDHRGTNADILRDFPLSRLVTILIQVSHAVAFAHSRGVIHRDLKPSNIMLGDFGEVMLMDWGLAKVGVVDVPDPASLEEDTPAPGERPTVGRAMDTQNGSVLGTPVYMPPEQALGQVSDLDARSDVYALGAILYELLTLRTPVEGQDIKEVLQKVIQGEIVAPEIAAPSRTIPRDLSAVAMKALSFKPEHRYQDAAAMRRDLELFLDGRMVSAREDNLVEVLTRFVRRHHIASLVVGITVTLLLSVATIGYLANDTMRHRAELLQRAAEENQARALASSQTAEQERQRAIAAQEQAEEQRRLADLARERANAALVSESRLRQRSEQSAHLAALSLASEQIARRDYDAARASLDACPLNLRDWAWRRLALLCHRNLAQFSDHLGAVRHLTVGNAEHLLASAGDDGSLVISDLSSRHRICDLKLNVTALGMAKNSPVLVVAEVELVHLVDARSGRTLAQIPLRDVTVVDVAADGTQVALGDGEGGLWWWEPANEKLQPISRLPATVSAVCLTHDRSVIAGTRTGVVLACQLDGGERWQHELPGRVLALSSQGLALIEHEENGILAIHDTSSGTALATIPGGAPIVSGCFSADGQRFAVVGDDRTARVMRSSDGSLVVTLEGHAGTVLDAQFHDGHSHLLTSAADGSVRLWDATQPVDVRQLAPPGRSSVVAVDLAGTSAMVAREDGTVQALHLRDGYSPWNIAIGFAPRITTDAASSTILAGSHGQLRVLDLRSGQILAEHGLGTASIHALVCDAAASRLVALDDEGWLRGLDRATGSRFAVQALPKGTRTLQTFDEGRQVLAGGIDGMLVWCSANDGRVLRREATSLKRITALAISDNTTVLALAGDDDIILCNSTNLQTTAILRGHAGAVNDLRFTSNGSRLISAGQDGTVRLWDTASGRLLLVLNAHSGGVSSARLLGEERELLTVGRDGRVLSWLALERKSLD